MSIDQPRVEAAVRELLIAIGEDPDRSGLLETPARVARSYAEILKGYDQTPEEILSAVFDVGHQELILVKDIEFWSL